MPWIKVPPEHHPLFRAALPADRRVTTMPLFGGVAAKVNGHVFAGLFGRSVMLALPEPQRSEALALDGAAYFEPMGDGRKSQKVMLPADLMDDPDELRRWIALAFVLAAKLPRKPAKPKRAKPANRPKPVKRASKPVKRAKR
ncbi:MAG: TfoX/Sxy family protein [Kofleriaceae bacterium]